MYIIFNLEFITIILFIGNEIILVLTKFVLYLNINISLHYLLKG